MFTTILICALGWVAATVFLTHAKVKVSAVLVHFATHGMSLRNHSANRITAGFLSIMTVGIPFDEYKRVHGIHHRDETFAGMQDEEAVFLYDLGFRPGMSRGELWRNFWRTVFSPKFHAAQIAARLRMNFIEATRGHVAGAWAFWSAVGMVVVHTNVATPFVIGALMPLFIGGNIGSFLELISRHRWMVTPQSASRRQVELSHGRFIAPRLPDVGVPWYTYVNWAGRVVIATIARLAVIPGDLGWHQAHHNGLKRAPGKELPAWTDAAYAYSHLLYANHASVQRNYTSIGSTIDAWFDALEKESTRR